jgi:hypothetical protein
MHASVTQLLSHRDREPLLVHTATHIDQCSECREDAKQLAQVQERLRALPSFDPPEHAWSLIRSRVQVTAPARRTWSFATAALIGAIAVLPLLFLVHQENARIRAKAAARAVLAQLDGTTDVLVSRSQQLEQTLQTLPDRPSVERAATSVAINALQERIQWLDSQLLYSSETGMDEQQRQSLWTERVQLLGSLVNVRYAEAARAGYLSANLTNGEYR